MKKGNKGMNWKKFGYSIAINLFFAVTLIIFGPSEIFANNREDFLFAYTDFAGTIIVAGIACIIIGTGLLMFLPDVLSELIGIIEFGITLGCYIQTMFLNGKMQSLTGYDIKWTTGDIVGNILIWGIIQIIVISVWAIQRKKQKIKIKSMITFVAGILTAVQVVAWVFLMITTDVMVEKKGGYVSADGMLELSEKDNVIVFILDTFDGNIMQAVLEENPDSLDGFDGFTYFPNATSMYSRTYPSITYLLTEQKCYFDEEVAEWVNTAYRESGSFNALTDNQVNIGLYTYPIYIGETAKEAMINWKWERQELDQRKILKYMAKMILYRDMPYVVKNQFKYTAEEINNSAILQKNQTEGFKLSDDEWFNTQVENNGLVIGEEKRSFRFYHLASCHVNLSEPVPYAERSLEIVRNYCDEMKKNGIYKDATIIIVADHGGSGGGKTLDLPQRTAVPLLLVKPKGSEGTGLAISEAPVSQAEIMPQILKGFSLDYEKYGRTAFEIKSDEERERLYYYSALYSDEEGEVELREYSVTGDARDPQSYRFTGNKWDILYSANRISQKKE